MVINYAARAAKCTRNNTQPLLHKLIRMHRPTLVFRYKHFCWNLVGGCTMSPRRPGIVNPRWRTTHKLSTCLPLAKISVPYIGDVRIAEFNGGVRILTERKRRFLSICCTNLIKTLISAYRLSKYPLRNC